VKNLRLSPSRNLVSHIQKCISESEKTPRNIFCLGCAVKVPVKSIVYPALKKVRKNLAGTNVKIGIGNDAYIFETDKKVELNRQIYPISLTDDKKKQKACRDIRKFKAHSAIVLASYMDPVSYNEMVNSLFNFYRALSRKRFPFCVGKGHTIQISKIPEQKFIMADYLTSKKGNYYGVANNDTIVGIDFNLKHSSWLNVYISLNNALNDLYALGVYKDITLYPVYDSIYDKDNKLIRNFLKRYLYNFKRYNYNVVDLGPLGLGLEAIGSTVIGFSDRELPRVSGLLPGQLLIVTRPIGDLAALVLYIIRKVAGELSADIRRLKIDVLSKMATSNIEIAKIISDYLPSKGDSFDGRRHITATKDISGEGVSAFEEMASQSKTHIYIDEIKLHTNKSSGLDVPNNTSNTNGAIIIAVHKKLAYAVMRRLKNIGHRAWIAGRVGAESKTPTIFLKKELKKKYPFLRYKSSQLFTRYKFI